MTEIERETINTFTIIIEHHTDGIEYAHVNQSDTDRIRKNAWYFIKGDETAAQKVLNSLAELIGVGPIVKTGETK